MRHRPPEDLWIAAALEAMHQNQNNQTTPAVIHIRSQDGHHYFERTERRNAQKEDNLLIEHVCNKKRI